MAGRAVLLQLLALPLLCSAWQHGREVGALRAAPEAPGRRGRVAADPEPLELNFTAAGLVMAADWPSNPKNGTPWYRTKKTDDRGQSSHEHFGGLAAEGDFEADMLAAHNAVRVRVGIPELQWSEGLHDIASKRVHKLASEGCYIRHSPLSDRWEESGFQYIGENLYKVINMNPTGVDVVDAWYAEIDDYTYGSVGSSCVKGRCAHRSSPPCVLGHFTQVMWQESTHVGCARAQCPGEVQQTYISVCNYGEGGNIVGRLPFSPRGSEQLGFTAQACDMPNTVAAANPSRSQPLHSAAPSHAAAQLASLAALLAAAAAAS